MIMDLEILVSASDKLTEELENILGGIRDFDQTIECKGDGVVNLPPTSPTSPTKPTAYLSVF